MADDRLRELERRWKETQSVEDEAAYLLERVRVGDTLDWESYSRLSELNVEAAAGYLRARVEVGDLEPKKLELAVYCSHEPARLVLGVGAPEVPPEPILWSLGLRTWGGEVLVRAAVAIAEAASERQSPEAARALSAARDWLRCPCSNHAKAARRAYQQIGPFDIDIEERDHGRFSAGVAAELPVMVEQEELLPMASVLISKCFTELEKGGGVVRASQERTAMALLEWALTHGLKRPH